jgi:adenylate kinase
MELNIDMVVALDVENNKLIERLLNRGKTSGRSDDKSEEKINKRLEEYDKKTKPLIDFYKNQKKFISINGVGDLNDVTTRLISIIDSKIS